MFHWEKVIIIDEVSIMGRNMLVQIEKRLRQAEYNIPRLQTLEIPIAKLQERHNCSEGKKKIPKKKMGYIPVYNLQRELM